MNRFAFCLLLLSLICPCSFAQQAKRIPPAGVDVSDNDRDQLGLTLHELGKQIDALRLSKDPYIINLLPDVMIYYKAVDYAIRYNEFFSPKDIESGKKLLLAGLDRAKNLKQKKAPWTTQHGEVLRGYISKIDNSVQPYGVTIPDNYSPGGPAFALSTWFHGRGETLGEISFMANGKGFTGSIPAMKNTIMLYPYGRYCNAFKFAGEIDVLEALADAEKKYKINKNGLFDRGFSMGGAAAWQFAVHYPDMWLAANPGAGFAETADFMDKFGHEVLHPSVDEKVLWHLYDCTDYASNLSNLPLYAYNGDKDPQRQAADTMAGAMKREGLKLNRIWGLNMGHGYTKAAAKTVDSLLAIEQAKGKTSPPVDLKFTTYTLKYNSLYWIQVDAMLNQWQETWIKGHTHGDTVSIKTHNVSAFTIKVNQLPRKFKAGETLVLAWSPKIYKIKITSLNQVVNFHFEAGNGNNKWVTGPLTSPWLIKKHNLQGPIDDAFMSAFIVVKPSGASSNALFDKWSKAEMNRFIEQWRTQFRGDAIVKWDYEITKADMQSNLIVFGDKQSNKFLAKLRDNELPFKLTQQEIILDDKSLRYPAKDHALVMIYPNPFNREHYIVLNSGFTFREDAYFNNSKQIPMLPDWAVIDLNTPPDSVHPGKIVSSGFFSELWQSQINIVE